MSERDTKMTKYGARVFKLPDGRILVKQTIKSGEEQTSDYVIDGHKERHVDPHNDGEIADAIRGALQGELSS